MPWTWEAKSKGNFPMSFSYAKDSPITGDLAVVMLKLFSLQKSFNFNVNILTLRQQGVLGDQAIDEIAFF